MEKIYEEELRSIYTNKTNAYENFYKKQCENIAAWKTTWISYIEKVKDKSLTPFEYYVRKEDNPKSFVHEISTEPNFGGITFPRICFLYGLDSNVNSDDLGKMINVPQCKVNEDNLKYLKDKDINECKKLLADNFKKYLKLFNECLDETESKKLDQLVSDSGYSAKAFIRKIVVINEYYNGNLKHPHVFADDAINRLAKKFDIKTKDVGYFELSEKILKSAKEIVKKDGDLIPEEYKMLSDSLWDMSIEKKDDFPTPENPNVIFYGAPGTGKTYAVKNFLKVACNEDTSRYEWVQFHNSYSYEDFIEGVKPVGIKDGVLKLELINGVFKDFCIRAQRNPEKDYYFVIDEINRANLSSVFGEILSLIEPSYRDDEASEVRGNLIKTQYSQLETQLYINKEKSEDSVYYYDENEKCCKFGVPKNLFIIGMMNDVDKSIDTFDLALRRRFKWVRMDCDYEVIKNELLKKGCDHEDVEPYVNQCRILNEFITGVNKSNKNSSMDNSLRLGKSYEFGHSLFINIEEKDVKSKSYGKVFDNFLKPTLKEYLRSFYEESELENKLDEAKKKFTPESKKSKDNQSEQ